MNCHNGEQFLQSSVKSILNQSYRNFELIFFDNKSTDSSLDIIEKFNDKRIKIFTTNRYHKLYKARNLAISKSKGDYISFLDTDDLFEKDKIKDQVTLIKANKNFDILYSNYYIFNQLKKKNLLNITIIYPQDLLLKNY